VVATFPITNANSVVYVGRKGAVNGIDMQPASPGDIITLYGIGFGPVAPTTAAGTIAMQSNSLTNQLTILFGEMRAEVEYEGLAPGYVGLYQFNVKVPNVPAGDWPLTIQAGGRTPPAVDLHFYAVTEGLWRAQSCTPRRTLADVMAGGGNQRRKAKGCFGCPTNRFPSATARRRGTHECARHIYVIFTGSL